MTYIIRRKRGKSFASIVSNAPSIGSILAGARSAGARSSIDETSDFSAPISPATSLSPSFDALDPSSSASGQDFASETSTDTPTNDQLGSASNWESVRTGLSIDTSGSHDQPVLRLVSPESPVDKPVSGGWWSRRGGSAKEKNRRPSLALSSEGLVSQASFNSATFDREDHGVLTTKRDVMGSQWEESSDDKEDSEGSVSIERDSWGTPIDVTADSLSESAGESQLSESAAPALTGFKASTGQSQHAGEAGGRGETSPSDRSNIGKPCKLKRRPTEVLHDTIGHLHSNLTSPGLQTPKRIVGRRNYSDLFESSSAGQASTGGSAPATAPTDVATESPTAVWEGGEAFRGDFAASRSQSLPVELEMSECADELVAHKGKRKKRWDNWVRRTASKMSSVSQSLWHRHRSRENQSLIESPVDSSPESPSQVYPIKVDGAISRHDSVHDNPSSQRDSTTAAESAYMPSSSHFGTKVSNYVGPRDDTPWISTSSRRIAASGSNITMQANGYSESVISKAQLSSDESYLSTYSNTGNGPAYDFLHRELVKGEKERQGRLQSVKRRFIEQASAVKSYLSTGGGRYGRDDDDVQSVKISDWKYSPSTVGLV
ncbi:hypothetical protein IAT40_004507 [Kwoniella sp. CBS 6097]